MTRPTRFRDDFSTFTAAMVGGALEVFLLGIVAADRWLGLAAIGNPFAFLAAGQAFLVAACLAAAAASHVFLGPLGEIVRGIHLFRQGDLGHRIPPSRVREINDLAAQLNRMAGDLRSLDAMKDDFVTTVSHELRSPMAAIEGYARLIEEEAGLSPRGAANLGKIAENLARLRALVERILDLSRITSGTLAVERKPADVSLIVAETASLFAAEMERRGVRFECSLPASLPPALADPLRARQIVTNLIDNAMKYNRRGGRLAVRGAARDGAVELSVADEGPGIPPEMQEAVFERFRRLPQTDAELASVKGVGLGLPISRGLARLMGGDVFLAESTRDGSRFVLRLPVAPAP